MRFTSCLALPVNLRYVHYDLHWGPPSTTLFSSNHVWWIYSSNHFELARPVHFSLSVWLFMLHSTLSRPSSCSQHHAPASISQSRANFHDINPSRTAIEATSFLRPVCHNFSIFNIPSWWLTPLCRSLSNFVKLRDKCWFGDGESFTPFQLAESMFWRKVWFFIPRWICDAVMA